MVNLKSIALHNWPFFKNTFSSSFLSEDTCVVFATPVCLATFDMWGWNDSRPYGHFCLMMWTYLAIFSWWRLLLSSTQKKCKRNFHFLHNIEVEWLLFSRRIHFCGCHCVALCRQLWSSEFQRIGWCNGIQGCHTLLRLNSCFLELEI